MKPVNLADYEALALERLAPGARDYIAGGAGDEVTLRENRAAFDRIRLLPRVLVDVSSVDASTKVLDQRVRFPVLVAPTAFHALAHPDGELATARAAAAEGTVMVVSTMSGFPLEDVAAAARGPKWFQLYAFRDRGVTRALVERAEAAGYGAVCLTVDLPRVGRRERDVRNQFSLPPPLRPLNFEPFVDLAALGAENERFETYIQGLVDPSLTWDVMDWLRSVTSLPILVKGILTAADAVLACERGADAIFVSNHGARQLDTVPATIEVLPEIADAVRGRAEILLDGGIRRGTDVVKAVALGARAVAIGRPCLYGLAVSGEEGVRHVFELLRTEVELAMALLGCPSLSALDRSFVRT